MTYLERTIQEVENSPRSYQTFSDVFFPSFLQVKNISENRIADREEEIRQLYGLLEKRLFDPSLSRKQKIDLMDYIEKLQLTLELLEVKRNPSKLQEIKKAAKHLGKKMQSGFSD